MRGLAATCLAATALLACAAEPAAQEAAQDAPKAGAASTAGAPASGSTAPAPAGAAAGEMMVSGSGGTPGPAGAGGSGGEPPAQCSDDCPKPGGVDWLCKLRFMYGINYAWHHFAGDIGGIAHWNQPGVSDNPAVDRELGELADNGVSVVRFWVWPDFRGDGVSFDDQDRPLGLGGTALSDLERLLELAEQHDLFLMLTLFSFDNFRATRQESGLHIPGIQPMVLDDTLRAQLIEMVVRPFARAVEQSPHARRVIAWDVINEPEWAIGGPSLYGGDEDFDPDPDLQSVSHAQMERFVSEVVEALRDESQALISVGGAAIKWRHAWSSVDVDFHHFHIYDWVDMWWPYDQPPAYYGLDDKPVVMGELPAGGLARADYATLVGSLYDDGYGGALAWSYSDYQGSLAPIAAFAELHPCQTRY